VTYDEIIQEARDRSPVFTEAVMDLGLARRRLGRIMWDMVRSFRLVDPRFYSTELTIAGTPGILDTWPTALTTGINTPFAGIDYLPETGHSAVVQGLPSDQASQPLTMVPWADRNRPFGQYPATFMDGVLYLLGSEDTWGEVSDLYFNHPTIMPTPIIDAGTSTFPFPSLMEEPVIAALALEMAMRAVGLDMKVPVEVFATAADNMKTVAVRTLLRQGRPRVKRVRDVMA
jgi:hypothetical protein